MRIIQQKDIFASIAIIIESEDEQDKILDMLEYTADKYRKDFDSAKNRSMIKLCIDLHNQVLNPPKG